MPTYDYQCFDCGSFEQIRRIANRDAPATCPQCGAQASRILIAAPSLASLTSSVRLAMATNEQSSHEPKHSSSYRHPQGCSCCKKTAKPGATPPALKSFAAGRPWMISH